MRDRLGSISGKRRQNQQRGSALLIVLVMAAIVGIMLYRELPIIAFEAQRQKEELLVERGYEYKRSVKLFVRKIGRFPASIDELEDTNRMRFLRRRYVDPMTGKDDWRLIHAGPGGVITDSQVKKQNKTGANALGQGAVFAGFNNSFSGDTATELDSQDAVPGMRARAAATKNAASVQGGNDLLGAPQQPLNANNSDTISPNTGVADLGAALNAAQQGPGTNPGVPSTYQFENSGATFDPNTGQATVPAGAPAGGENTPASGIGSVAQQLNNVNPRTAEQGAQTTGIGMGQVGGNGQLAGAGGIAGVASKAPGSGIKRVAEQSKYSLWEFYYDMAAEQSAGMNNALQGAGGNSANQSQWFKSNNGASSPANTSAFGTSSQTSSFGAVGNSGTSAPSSGNSQPSASTQPPNDPNATPPPPQ